MNTTPATTRSFARRITAAVAGAVVAALALFGAVGMDAPEPSADQEAGGTWSFMIGDDGKGGPGPSTQGMTWS